MACVSDDTAPKRCSSSSNVSPISSFGIGWPSLNRSGRRISNRRNVPLISRRPLYRKRNPLDRQEWQRRFGDEHLTRRPALERKTARQKAQGLQLLVRIGK